MISQHGDSYDKSYPSDVSVLRRIKWGGKEMLTSFLLSRCGDGIPLFLGWKLELAFDVAASIYCLLF